MLVLGSALLEEPELVRSVVDIFDRHPEIDRQMHILATCGKAADILAAQPPGAALPGQYVAAIYKDKRKIGGTSFSMDLEKLVTQMKYEEAVLIPLLEAEDENLSLTGAAVLKNGQKIGTLNEDELRGYLWCFSSGGLGAVVTTEVEGRPVPYKVEKHKARVRFKEHGDKLLAHIQIDLTGRIEEMAWGDGLNCPSFREYAKHRLEAAIKKEILRTANKMQEEFNLDGYHWLETMRKKQYSLYQRHAARRPDIFADIEVMPSVNVTVKGLSR